MSVSCLDYNSLSGYVCITDIDGQDLKEQTTYDTDVPIINVNLNSYDINLLPKAAVGVSYPLFTATAIDGESGIRQVNTSVWYSYSTPQSAARVTVKNNTFTPERKGIYTIVYTASDEAGNIASYTVDIIVTDLKMLELTLLSDASASAKAGSYYKVKTPQLEYGSGKINLKIIAENKTENVSYIVDMDNYTFAPMYSGEYTIYYYYSDYLGEKVMSYKITVQKAVGSFIKDEASVPKYVYTNSKIILPSLNGYLFTDNNFSETQAKIAVSQDGGNFADVNGQVKITAQNTFSVKYYLPSSGETYNKIYDIPVINDGGIGIEGKLSLASYFKNIQGDSDKYQLKQAIINAQDNGIDIKATNDSVNTMAYTSVLFTNSVLSSDFELWFKLLETNFGKVVIYLTDSENSEQQIKLVFRNTGSWKTVLSLNDGYEYQLNYRSSATYELSYDRHSNQIKCDTSKINVKNYLNGKSFSGFSSNMVYVNIQLEGIYLKNSSENSKAAITLIKLNNQPLSNVTNDYILPQISSIKSEGDRYINEIADIVPVYAADVIDPLVLVSMTVQAPDGTIVKAEDGTLLDSYASPSTLYKIKLTQNGDYTVKYTIRAVTSKQDYDYSYNIKVVDNSPPDVTIIKPETTAKVGETVKIADIEVKDNLTKAENIKITIFAMTPTGKMILIEDGVKSISVDNSGIYKIYYYVQDEGVKYGSETIGNVTITSYSLTVTEK